MGKNNQISKGKIINIILGICMQIYFLYPWICAEQGRYNAITYIFCVIKQGGFKKAFCHSFSKGAELIPDSMGVLTFQFNTILALVFIVQILAVCAIVISFRKDVLPRWIYGISLFSVAFTFIVWTADTMPDTSVGYVPRAEIITRTTYMYPLVFIFVTVVWLLLMFMADDLDNVSEMQRQKKRRRRNLE